MADETRETTNSEHRANGSDPQSIEPIGGARQSILDVLKRNHQRIMRIFLHVLLIIGIGVATFGVGAVFRVLGRNTLAVWAEPLIESHPHKIAPDLTFSIDAPQAQRERLQDQYQMASMRAEHHLRVTETFYLNYFQGFVVFLIAAALAALSLALMSKNGWGKANEYVIATFLVSTTIAAIQSAMPGIYRQPENIEDNQTLYMQYVGLMNEMLSYCVTGEPMSEDAGEPLEVEEFIHHVDRQLAAMGRIAVGFDYSQAPTYEGIFNTPE